MDFAKKNKKGGSADTYTLDAAVRNVNRLKWNLTNLPDYLRKLGATSLDPAARAQLAERERTIQVEHLPGQLDQTELEGIRLRYSGGSD